VAGKWTVLLLPTSRGYYLERPSATSQHQRIVVLELLVYFSIRNLLSSWVVADGWRSYNEMINTFFVFDTSYFCSQGDDLLDV
jgi:hypothetical protein